MNTNLSTVLLNAKILRWLRSLSPEQLDMVIEFYAAKLQCPVDEIDPDFTNQSDINWLWATFGRQIQEWEIFNE